MAFADPASRTVPTAPKPRIARFAWPPPALLGGTLSPDRDHNSVPPSRQPLVSVRRHGAGEKPG